MAKILLLLSLFITLPALSQNYPAAKKTPKTITKHGIAFADDYIWLENMPNPDVNTWVDAQNGLFDAHIKAIGTEETTASKIMEYDKLSSSSLPEKKRRYFYSRYRVAKDKPAVLFYRKTLEQTVPVEIADPTKIFGNTTTVLMEYYPSETSTYLACTFSPLGSDRHQVRFMDIFKKETLPDVLNDIKFSNIAWNRDKGVFYKKNSNLATFERDSTYQLFYHAIGTPQAEDQLIFDTSKTENQFSYRVIDDKLFIVEKNKDATANYYYLTLNAASYIPVKFIDRDDTDFRMQTYKNGRVYFTTKDYDWGEVRSFALNNRADETVVIPQVYTHLLTATSYFEDYIVCKYKTLGKYHLSVYDTTGKFIRKFDAPPGTDIRVRFYNRETKSLYVTVQSYVLSYHNFSLNIETGEFLPYYNDYIKAKPTLFPLDYFDVKTTTFKSRDGKDVPITIVHKKGMPRDGNNPALLKAYGGFGNVNNPAYESGIVYFLEKGGVFAFAEVRGGGEKGLKWHTGGKGPNKKNGVNDFIDAAEFLISEKYTSAARLGITGGSHGGFITGAAMVKRPELFKVAIPEMGAFDLAKFQDYTVGRYHIDEFGNPDVKADYVSLLQYSPYYNLKDGVNYPTTLIVTSEHDDRVPPVHSYKFAARLQNRAGQVNPVYLKVIKNSGHSGGTNYEARINEEAEFYSFLLYHLTK
jgi:prolyl oligopeptidase